MTDLDPHKVHEVLAIALILVFIPTAFCSALYIRRLTCFFDELRHKDTEIWVKIGSPTFANMLFMPLRNFRKFYAFLPVLLAEKDNPNYKNITLTLSLFKICAVLNLLMFALAIALIAWMEMHNL